MPPGCSWDTKSAPPQPRPAGGAAVWVINMFDIVLLCLERFFLNQIKMVQALIRRKAGKKQDNLPPLLTGCPVCALFPKQPLLDGLES